MVHSVFAGVTLFSSWFIEKDVNITEIFDFLEFFVFWFSSIHISINLELEQGFFMTKVHLLETPKILFIIWAVSLHS